MFKDLGKKVNTFASKTKLWTKKNSPKILMVTGIVGIIGTVVTTVVATRKIDKVLEPTNKKIEALKADLANDELIANEEIDINFTKKEISREYLKGGLKVVGLYTPTMLFMTGTIASFIGSYKIMNSRNVALATAYASLDRLFADYRGRVRDKYGKDAEEDIYFDRQYEEVVDEKGKVIGKTLVSQIDNSQLDDLRTFVYDEGSVVGWTNDMNINVCKIKMAQAAVNLRLTNGSYYLTLFDIWEELGVRVELFTPNQIMLAKMVGWIYDPSDNKRANCVTFGVSDEWDRNNDYAQKQIRNKADNITLSFNFDGNIYNVPEGHMNVGQLLSGCKE